MFFEGLSIKFMDDIVDRSCLIGYKVRIILPGFLEYELTHSKETYQPRMRWDRNIFYDSHGDSTPQKRLKRLKLDIVLSWRQNIKQKRMLNQLNMECWNLCRGEPWMIVFKKLSCLIVFVRHGA